MGFHKVARALVLSTGSFRELSWKEDEESQSTGQEKTDCGGCSVYKAGVSQVHSEVVS